MVLYWLLAPAALLALTCIILVIGTIVFSRLRNSPLPAGLPRWSACGLAPLLGLVAFLALPAILNGLRSDESALQEIFGMPVPPGVAGIQSQTDSGADFREILLAFDRNPAGQRVVQQMFGRETEVPESDRVASMATGDGLPSWWKGAPAWAGKNSCPNAARREYDDWQGWQFAAVIECVSDERIYVAVSNID